MRDLPEDCEKYVELYTGKVQKLWEGIMMQMNVDTDNTNSHLAAEVGFQFNLTGLMNENRGVIIFTCPWCLRVCQFSFVTNKFSSFFLNELVLSLF